jgi:hypothetical protein
MRDAADALNRLGAQLGVDALAFDQDGDCGIVIDGETEIFFRAKPEDDILQITGVVGDLYPGGGVLAIRLLELNAVDAQTGPAAFAVDPATAEILLTLQVTISLLSEEQLLAIVEDFVDRVEYWSKYLPKLDITVEEFLPSDAPSEALLFRG